MHLDLRMLITSACRSSVIIGVRVSDRVNVGRTIECRRLSGPDLKFVMGN